MTDWWNHIKPQVEEMLQELCFNGIYADDMHAILDESDWMGNRYIKSVEFNYESARFTFRQLNDMFTLLTGSNDVFVGAIKYRIKEMLASPELQRPIIEEIKEEVA